MTARTSIAQYLASGQLAAISTARSSLSTSTVEVAGELLLGLGERPVGGRDDAVAHAHGLRLRRRGEPLAADPLARRRAARP